MSTALDGSSTDRYNNDVIEIARIYNQIKRRKIHDINRIEELLSPLVPDHPEIQPVLDIIRGWKPELTETEDLGESGDLRKSLN